MTSSYVGNHLPGGEAQSSSSNQPPDLDIPQLDNNESDDDDPVASYNGDHNLLGDDPLNDEILDTPSFKRKQKQPASFISQIFLSPFIRSGQPSPSVPTYSPRSGSQSLNNDRAHGDGEQISLDTNPSHTKDGASLDWYTEGPGRRVGYEDMTAIDWIFEYTKERQRLRALYSNATGIIGYAREMADASQIWIVLLLTGMAAGLVAAGIDVASDWLGDIKSGYCSNGPDGGHFYLNRYFCCWGYDEWSQCQDWTPWAVAMNVTSAGGKWFLEYFFFVAFSVSLLLASLLNATNQYY
jgi:chloride channel 3/4/5